MADIRRSLGDEAEAPVPPPTPPHPARRASDKLDGVVSRINNLEKWAVSHHECHSDAINAEMRRFVSSDDFPKAIAKAWTHDDVKELFATLKDQIIGGVVSAIFGNHWFRLLAAALFLLMLGVDYKDIKELLLKILLNN